MKIYVKEKGNLTIESIKRWIKPEYELYAYNSDSRMEPEDFILVSEKDEYSTLKKKKEEDAWCSRRYIKNLLKWHEQSAHQTMTTGTCAVH